MQKFPPTESDGRTIQSVEHSLGLLEFVMHNGGAEIAELAEAVDLSRSTVHHYLTTLENHGYVVDTGEGYDIGLRFLMFGGYARRRLPVFRPGKKGVDRLAAETGETARLVVPWFGSGFTVYQSNERTADPPTYLGSYEPLHSTAAGKAVLAALDPGEVERLLDRELEPQTRHTTTDPETLLDELERVRARDVAFDDEEQFEGIRCVATSVTAGSDVVGAISVQVPVERAGDERFREELPDAVQNVAGVIELDTVFSEWETDDPPRRPPGA